MSYPYSTPSMSMDTIWTSGQYTPENVVTYIRDDQTPINKNSMRNSLGYQLSLVQNFVNSHFLGRSEVPVNSGYLSNIYVTDGTITWKHVANWDPIFSINSYIIKPETDDGSDSGILYLCGGGNTTISRGAFISIAGNEASAFGAPGQVVINGSGYVALKTDNVVRMKIFPDGKTLFGSTGTPDEVLHVNGNIKASSTLYSNSIYASGVSSEFYTTNNQTYMKMVDDAIDMRASGQLQLIASGNLKLKSYDQMYIETWYAHMNLNIYGNGYRFDVACHGTDGFMSLTAPYINLYSLQGNGYINLTAVSGVVLNGGGALTFKSLPTSAPGAEYQVYCDVADGNTLKCTTYS